MRRSFAVLLVLAALMMAGLGRLATPADAAPAQAARDAISAVERGGGHGPLVPGTPVPDVGTTGMIWGW